MKLSKNIWQERISDILDLRTGEIPKVIAKTKMLLKGLLIGISLVFAFVGGVFGFELILEALEECATIVVEFAQESLEILYRKQFKLDIYHAQMATAYSGFVILVVMAYFATRKLMIVLGKMQKKWEKAQGKALKLKEKYKERFEKFWVSLDAINRVFLGVGVVVVAVPLISIVCIALGKLVAELI